MGRSAAMSSRSAWLPGASVPRSSKPKARAPFCVAIVQTTSAGIVPGSRRRALGISAAARMTSKKLLT